MIDSIDGFDIYKEEEKFESLSDLRRWLRDGLGDCSGYSQDEIEEMIDRLVDYVHARPEFQYGKYIDMGFLVDEKFFLIALGEIDE